MPAKNRLKEYVSDSYYHIYNRGVEKRDIFLDSQDYAVYISYLATYIEPKNEIALGQIIASEKSSSKDKDKALKLLRLNNFYSIIDLVSFCLMPNHFHLLVRQKEKTVIDMFMNSLSTRYTMYFNRKYKRVGSLYQGIYKAVRMQTDEQLLYLTKYIHSNPKKILASQGQALRSWSHSSYPVYLGLHTMSWVKPSLIETYFSKKGLMSYESFVEDVSDEEKTVELLAKIKIDD